MSFFAEDAEGITARISVVDTSEEFEVRASYLAGCDGAGSFVARTIGASAEKATLLAQSTNIFIRSRALTERAAARPAYRYILIDERGAWGSMINMNGYDVWRIQVLGDLGGGEWDAEKARGIIDKAIGAPIEYELVSIIPWSRRELVVDHFSCGRCFLVGDAAHQLSPTGGYGMNTGIAEAVDLSWKLEAVLGGWGGQQLLGSYDIERRPIAIRNAARSTVNFGHMREVPGDPRLFAPDTEGDAVREEIGNRIRVKMADEWDSMGIHLGYNYANSPIVIADGSPPPVDDPANYRQTSKPGARAPHAWISPGRSTLDLFGRGFVLLVFSGTVDPEPLVRAAETRAVPLEVVQLNDLDIGRLYELPMVLVRPDGHVAWRGEVIGDDALAVIDTVRGASGESVEAGLGRAIAKRERVAS